MRLRPPLLLPHQTLLPLQLLHPGIVGTQTQDHSCWIQPANRSIKNNQFKVIYSHISLSLSKAKKYTVQKGKFFLANHNSFLMVSY